MKTHSNHCSTVERNNYYFSHRLLCEYLLTVSLPEHKKNAQTETACVIKTFSLRLKHRASLPVRLYKVNKACAGYRCPKRLLPTSQHKPNQIIMQINPRVNLWLFAAGEGLVASQINMRDIGTGFEKVMATMLSPLGVAVKKSHSVRILQIKYTIQTVMEEQGNNAKVSSCFRRAILFLPSPLGTLEAKQTC